MKPILPGLAAMLLAAPAMAGDGAAKLSFSSFDGGGPEFSVRADTDIVSCSRSVHYHDPDHGDLEGAGYTVTLTFTGQRPGEASITVLQRAPIDDDLDMVYAVRVDSRLNVEIRKTGEHDAR